VKSDSAAEALGCAGNKGDAVAEGLAGEHGGTVTRGSCKL
jgi:hypothetical protein